MRALIQSTLLMAYSSLALAVELPPPPSVPEPETIALFAIGAVAAVVARRNRRK